MVETGFLGRPVQLVRRLGGLLGHGYASTPVLAVPALAYEALTTPTGGFRSATGGASLTP